MDEVSVVVAHSERATVRVGDVFLKVDGDLARIKREVEAMRLAPVPTPDVLWHRPPVLAIGAIRGRALDRGGQDFEVLAAELDDECGRLVADGVLPADLVAGNRMIAEAALRSWTPVFTHGDLHVAHVFVDGDEVTGVIDWSEAGRGDALYDLASLTVVHQEHLGDVVAGYGSSVDLEVVRGWWSLRTLMVVRWLTEHGYDPFRPGGAVEVLKAALAPRRG